MRIAVLFLLLSFSSYGQEYNCSNLPKNFTSYDSAIKIINSAIFAYKDSSSQFTSSWIKSISYYSCDKKMGFLIVRTHDDKNYVHKNVPIEIWKSFKNASSKGSFYSSNIRGKYKFNLKSKM